MKKRLPAEWEPQSLIQFTFPHPTSDWAAIWSEAVTCFVNIIEATLQFEPVLLVAYNYDEVRSLFKDSYKFPLHIIEQASNDSWARDHGPITILEGDQAVLLDFGFNGWGLKFPANLDNTLNLRLFEMGLFKSTPFKVPGLILEGGSIESDGQGTILTTSQCLLSNNRNPHLNRHEIEQKLKDIFGENRILWLESGYLIGDDTDAHIDTLARFCNTETIAYVFCEDEKDAHFLPLRKMEEELQFLKTSSGDYYNLVGLPLPDPIYHEDGHRLPATYVNFLILNGAVLVPTYAQPKDDVAIEILGRVFENRKIVGIDCRALIQQHGSLHCVTMQYPIQVQNIW